VHTYTHIFSLLQAIGVDSMCLLTSLYGRWQTSLKHAPAVNRKVT